MKFGNDDSVASASHGIVPEHREPPNKVLPERKKSIEEAETSKFQEFKKLIHAATRPLPTETGDGSYIEDETSGGLWADFRALGMKDASTLVSMLENKLSGAFVDDKTMMMEHIIQVPISSMIVRDTNILTRLSSWSADCPTTRRCDSD